MSVDTDKFAVLNGASRLWAIGAVHGRAERLAALHDAIAERFKPGDRVVYLGDLIGHGDRIRETVDEALRFRRDVLAQPPLALIEDVVFLRGAQEEMWRKLLQVQFAAEPEKVLAWMFERGVDATLRTYGGVPEAGFAAAAEGMVALARWTSGLRNAMKAMPGHTEFLLGLRRAAMTDTKTLLFVNAGLDPKRPLDEQADRFWWDSAGFSRVEAPYQGFGTIVRGFDPTGEGVTTNLPTISLDGGATRDGPLVAGFFSADGSMTDMVEA